MTDIGIREDRLLEKILDLCHTLVTTAALDPAHV